MFLLAILVYTGNGRVMGSWDTLPARYLPISLLRHLSFQLDEFPVLYDEAAARRYSHGGGKPYFLKILHGHYVSAYTPGPALLALPVYAVPVLAGMPSTSKWVPRLEKLSATLITALSVLFLFWALRELIADKWALAVAMIYAFGTSSFSVSSQALWQHGPSQFFLALALYLLVRGKREERYLPYAGFALASSIVMRPTDALLALPVGLYFVHRHRSVLLKIVLFSLPPMAFFLAYNSLHSRSILGFETATEIAAWRTPFFEGFSGLLFSPSRGLFVYSPILILSIAGIFIAWSEGHSFLKYLSIGPLLVVLLYSKWFMWWGGYCYGPRLLADLAPVLCFFLYPVCQKIEGHGLLIGAFVTLGLISIGFHALGAYWNDGGWDGTRDISHNQYRLWSWRDSPFIYCGKAAYDRTGELYDSLKDRRGPASSVIPYHEKGKSLDGRIARKHRLERSEGVSLKLSLGPVVRFAYKPSRRSFPGRECVVVGCQPVDGDDARRTVPLGFNWQQRALDGS